MKAIILQGLCCNVEFNLYDEFEDLSVNKSSGRSAELLSPSSGSDSDCINVIETFVRPQFLTNLLLIALTCSPG